ncbi:Riboflavin biosynthesis protein RibD [Alphaproteobacteria bacterium SO-S41]|nr:Riboflavin biosynthesis protein RibD [Alphaproteobacteria bacterium SO-S41]
MVAATTDLEHMAAALVLARRGLGLTWPNPAVGCVIVDAAGRVAGRGWTQPGGRPHAETEALKQAGERARDGTAYVTLEPCAHYGKTPPCAEALIAAGIARVVAAIEDPDPRTAGQGFAKLEAAGIKVTRGVRRGEAVEVTAGFLTRITKGRPFFLLKSAMTLDGRIAAHTGASRWITGEAARARGHLSRAQADAVLVGIGTAIADDPQLDVRLPGLTALKPVRIVADARLRLPLTSKLARSARTQPLWVISRPDADKGRAAAFRDLGAEVLHCPAMDSGELDLTTASRLMGERGLTRVLVEGGGRIAAGLMRAGVIDRIEAYRSGLVMGGDGLAGIAAMGVTGPATAPHYDLVGIERVGEDVLETWAARA